MWNLLIQTNSLYCFFNETLLWHCFLDRNIGSNEISFLPFQVCSKDAVTEWLLLPNFRACRRLSFLCSLQDFKIACINSWIDKPNFKIWFHILGSKQFQYTEWGHSIVDHPVDVKSKKIKFFQISTMVITHWDEKFLKIWWPYIFFSLQS